jgi:hypothetical protein
LSTLQCAAVCSGFLLIRSSSPAASRRSEFEFLLGATGATGS